MLTYEDIKNMKRGKEAEIEAQSSMIAARKIQEVANDENQQTQEVEDEALKADAQKIIQELQNNPDLDPQQVMDSLPPILQHAVLEQMGQITEGSPMDENSPEEEMEGSEMPMEEESSMPINGSEMPNPRKL